MKHKNSSYSFHKGSILNQSRQFKISKDLLKLEQQEAKRKQFLEKKQAQQKSKRAKLKNQIEKVTKDDDSESIDSNLSFYEVQYLIDRRQLKEGELQYLVKWEGFPNSQNTWEPVQHLRFIKNVVDEFNLSYEAKIEQKKKIEQQAQNKREAKRLLKEQQQQQQQKVEQTQNVVNHVKAQLHTPNIKKQIKSTCQTPNQKHKNQKKKKSQYDDNFLSYVKKIKSQNCKENDDDDDDDEQKERDDKFKDLKKRSNSQPINKLPKVGQDEVDEQVEQEDVNNIPYAILGFRRRPDYDMNILVQMNKKPGQRQAPKKMVLYSELRVCHPELIIDFMEQNLIFEEESVQKKLFLKDNNNNNNNNNNNENRTQNLQEQTQFQ